MTDHIQVAAQAPRIQYAANGIQTAFTFPFPIFNAGDLEVWLGTVKQSPTAYSLSGVGISSGGTVLFAAAPATGSRVTLRRRLAIGRTSDFQSDGLIRANVLNDELDYQTAAIQQVAEDASRAVARAFTSASTADLTLPEPVAGRAIKWNGSGTGLENSAGDADQVLSQASQQATSAANSAAAAAQSQSTSTANAAQTAADRSAVHADRLAADADAAQTAADRAAIHADRLAADADAAQTAADRTAVHADRLAADADAAQTAADRAATHADRLAADTDATNAASAAAVAQTAATQAVAAAGTAAGTNFWCGTTGGTAAALTAASAPAATTYFDGMRVLAMAHTTVTNGATLNLSALGAKALYQNGIAIKAGAVKAGQLFEAIYRASDGRLHLAGATPMDPAINTAINALRGLGITGGPTRGYNMWVDGCNDTTGMDLLNSGGIQYDATNKWVSNFIGTYPASYTVVDNLADTTVTGLWTLNNTAADSSYNGYNLTGANLTYTTTGAKQYAQVGLFNGTSALASTSNHAPYNFGLGGPATFECWVKSSTTATMCVAGRNGGAGAWNGTTGHQWLINTDASGHIVFSYAITGPSWAVITSSSVVTDGSWHHIAVTWDGTTFRMFIDGAAIGTSTTTPTATSSPTTFQIGYAPTAYWNGAIVGVRYSNICRYAAAGYTPPLTPFVVATGFALQSPTLSAVNGTPAAAFVVLRHQDLLGTATVGTDILVDVSSNGGTSWDTLTNLTKADPWDGATNILVGSVALTGGGTSIKSRIRTANNKPQRIRAQAILWS
jgi:hypothetical protein